MGGNVPLAGDQVIRARVGLVSLSLFHAGDSRKSVKETCAREVPFGRVSRAIGDHRKFVSGGSETVEARGDILERWLLFRYLTAARLEQLGERAKVASQGVLYGQEDRSLQHLGLLAGVQQGAVQVKRDEGHGVK